MTLALYHDATIPHLAAVDKFYQFAENIIFFYS